MSSSGLKPYFCCFYCWTVFHCSNWLDISDWISCIFYLKVSSSPAMAFLRFECYPLMVVTLFFSILYYFSGIFFAYFSDFYFFSSFSSFFCSVYFNSCGRMLFWMLTVSFGSDFKCCLGDTSFIELGGDTYGLISIFFCERARCSNPYGDLFFTKY